MVSSGVFSSYRIWLNRLSFCMLRPEMVRPDRASEQGIFPGIRD
jgi:hypothetical protein